MPLVRSQDSPVYTENVAIATFPACCLWKKAGVAVIAEPVAEPVALVPPRQALLMVARAVVAMPEDRVEIPPVSFSPRFCGEPCFVFMHPESVPLPCWHWIDKWSGVSAVVI